MRVDDLGPAGAARPRPLAYSLPDTPHFTLETNKTCNIRCRACYSLERTKVKTRAELRAELETGLALRKAGVVTLLGGEPTLHPELPGIVADVKARGLRCQVLTNGVLFLQPERDTLLDRLAAAGVDRIIIHMDEGQGHIHRDIDAARRTVFDKLELRRLRFGLSLTIFPETQGRLPAVLRAYAAYRYFDSILAVLARDPLRPDEPGPGLGPEAESLRRELGAEPTAFLPSNRSDEDVRWLVYALVQRPRSGRAIAVPPGLYALVSHFYRLAFRRRLYVPFLPRRAASPLPSLGFRFVVIQEPPAIEAEDYILCRYCPDATVRNGRLVPLCIADMIDPLDGRQAEPTAENRLRSAAVRSSLGLGVPPTRAQARPPQRSNL